MASVQDHTPVVKELSERNQQDPQSSRAEKPLPTPQQGSSKARDPSDLPRAITETPREHSPPRFSQLLDPLPEATKSTSPRRGLSTATDPTTLVNHPGTIGNSAGGAQIASVVQDRNHIPSTLAPDRHLSIPYDPIRGDSVPVQFSDDGEHDHRVSMRHVSLPRPRPIFSLLQDGNGGGSGGGSRTAFSRGVPGLDWNPEPHEPQQAGPKTVRQRLDLTHAAATREQAKYKRKARQQSLMINGAIGLQVIVGAITTGVAAASTNIGSAVAVLGGISTALASYLAKARGSGEPEFSTLRARELSTFLREVDAFIMDNGDKVGLEFDYQITMYRERFEEIIKTEAETSTSGTGYFGHSRHNQAAPAHSASQQAMAGRNFQAMPPHADMGNGQLSEKQMWKNEKALGGMV